MFRHHSTTCATLPHCHSPQCHITTINLQFCKFCLCGSVKRVPGGHCTSHTVQAGAQCLLLCIVSAVLFIIHTCNTLAFAQVKVPKHLQLSPAFPDGRHPPEHWPFWDVVRHRRMKFFSVILKDGRENNNKKVRRVPLRLAIR